MVVVGWCCAVQHKPAAVMHLLHLKVLILWGKVVCVITAQILQIPLQPRTGVLRSHTLVSMRQENYNATLSDLLGLSTVDKLIKDALCIVGKIPKLGFPADQRIWIRHRVAELKAQYSKLRKRAVTDNILSLVITEVIQLVVCHVVFILVM